MEKDIKPDNVVLEWLCGTDVQTVGKVDGKGLLVIVIQMDAMVPMYPNRNFQV